jgi:large subunit ribosomal protein L23
MTDKKTVKKPVKAEKKAKAVKAKPAKKELPFNPWKVLLYPHLAEKSMNMVELENKLVFVVNRNATRTEIKKSIEKGFNVKVLSVNTEITTKGDKKAYIKLHSDHMAGDIASRLGMI